MKYASVCSGIEAATVAWHPLGWKPVWFSQYDPEHNYKTGPDYPSAVLQHHYPEVPNLGDMTKLFENPIVNGEKIDLIVGGTPCQSFSIAGLRKGLNDPRGNLTLTYLKLIDLVRPTWVVWENVFGVLSSNKGRDFGTFVGALEKLGYGIAYRVLDAQYFGVPQKRRRVFVVGYLGNWQRAAEVFFNTESLCWNSAPRRQRRPTDTTWFEDGLGEESAGGDVGGDKPLVFCVRGGRKGGGKGYLGNHQAAYTLMTKDYQYLYHRAILRRLTPLECARLQGFPDDYLDIIYRGKPAADTHKYKALGNSMPVPVMRWLGQRIEAVHSKYLMTDQVASTCS